MKIIFGLIAVTIAGCSTAPVGYLQYLEQTSKLAASQNAAEAACLLVIAEGMKTGDTGSKAVLASQIDKCRKDPVKVEPPKNWLGW